MLVSQSLSFVSVVVFYHSDITPFFYLLVISSSVMVHFHFLSRTCSVIAFNWSGQNSSGISNLVESTMNMNQSCISQKHCHGRASRDKTAVFNIIIFLSFNNSHSANKLWGNMVYISCNHNPVAEGRLLVERRQSEKWT